MKLGLGALIAASLVGLLGPTTTREALAATPPDRIDFAAEGFKVIAYERGVTVYQNDKANMVAIGAVVLLPTSPDRVQAALLNYENHVGKVARLAETRVLSRDPDGLYVYQRLSLPVIADRDFTLRVDHGSDGSKWWIKYAAVTDHGPAPRSGIVRVTRNHGLYELLSAAGGKATLVKYETFIDLGGTLPLWMARGDAGKDLPALMGVICRMSTSPSEQAGCP